MARKTKSEVEEVIQPQDGIAIEGAAGLPHNHRLRAEKLVEMGEAEDPDGLISPELIADTKDRLEREAKAAEEAAKQAEAEAAGETENSVETDGSEKEA